MAKKEFLLTSEGFLDLETELNELKNVRRPKVIEAIKDFKAAMEEMRPAKNKSNEKPSKEEMQKKKKEVNAKIKSILTDEQYKKYQDMRKKDNADKKKRAK